MTDLGKRRVAITGISGFTGRHLTKRLAACGWEVIGIGADLVDGAKEVKAIDLNEPDLIADWLEKSQPSHIIHLAALSHVMSNSLDFFRVNVLGTENLIKAIVHSKIKPKKVIVASSANVYGNVECEQISENELPKPTNHYALSKASMEMMLRGWFDRLPIVIVRPFNYTGPGQSESFVFPKIAAAFSRRDESIMLGNLDVHRDLSDVSYICEAYRRLLECPYVSEFVNLCSGNLVSLGYAIDYLKNKTSHKVEICVDSRFVRNNEIKSLRGDVSLMRKIVGDIKVVPVEIILDGLLDYFDSKYGLRA